MSTKYLLMLGVAAVMASCSGNDYAEEAAKAEVPFDGVVSLTAESNISVIQSRAVVDKWNNTPIRVWGLDKNGMGWNTATGNLFAPSNYVDGVVTDATGVVKLGNPDDVFFYPLNSDINFSFYACSPLPLNPSLTGNSATVQYNVPGNVDIMWAEAVAPQIQGKDGKQYEGYNARYFRKGGKTPKLQFKHLLSQLQFAVFGGDEGHQEAGKVWPVTVKNITVSAPGQASLAVAGPNKGILSPVGPVKELPAYFGDETYKSNLAVQNQVETPAGTVMLLPEKSGVYTLNVTLAAMVNGKEITKTNSIKITYKNQAQQVSPFEAGKAYKVKLTVYGLRIVDITAGLDEWVMADQTIDQEVN